MQHMPTMFGSLQDYEKGGVEIVSGDVKHYVFSNIFEVANGAAPYEKVVVGKNLEYVQEVLRAEGVSPWFACAHDEFALCMDGKVTVDFVKLETSPPDDKRGTTQVDGDPVGPRMGEVKIGRGHKVLLPAGSAYRFTANQTGVLLLQTVLGDLSVEKWDRICLT